MRTDRKKRWVDWSNEMTQLYGMNVGQYPEHHFCFIPRIGILQRYPLYVNQAGYDLMCQGVFRQRKNCNVCSFELVTEGKIRYESNGSVYECGPGDLFIMHLHSDNRLECLTPLAKTISIGYDGEQLLPVLKQLGLSHCEYIHLDNWDDFSRKAERISALAENRNPDVFAEMASLGYEALLNLSTHLHGQSEMPPLLSKIIAYMNSHIGRRILVTDLAQRFSVSQGTIFRLFHLYLQCAPNEYLIQLRLEYAKRMLVESNYSIKEISAQCGFCNQLYFSQVFRKRNGCSPLQFRKDDK